MSLNRLDLYKVLIKSHEDVYLHDVMAATAADAVTISQIRYLRLYPQAVIINICPSCDYGWTGWYGNYPEGKFHNAAS